MFCLRREQWTIRPGSFDIDHFTPQVNAPHRALDYDNLLYVCHTCNLLKSELALPDPCSHAFGECVEVSEDGIIRALNPQGQLMIDILRLDSSDHTRYRAMLISTVRDLAAADYQTLVLWMGYPSDLPDLTKLRPPSNSRPDGVRQSHHARRQRGELPELCE